MGLDERLKFRRQSLWAKSPSATIQDIPAHETGQPMNLRSAQCLLLFFGAVCIVPLKLTIAQQARNSAENSNDYVERLERAKSNLLKIITDRKFPDATVEALRDQIKQYDFQIEKAKAAIVGGENYGQSEYEAAIRAIEKASHEELQRSKIKITDTFDKARSEADRIYEQSISMSNQKHRDTVDRANDQFQRTKDAANLLLKFRLSAGRIGMIIWNLPLDQKLHRRSTTTVNIRLLNDNRVVWNRRNYQLDRKQPGSFIQLPNVAFNQVIIDVARWQGEGGGLAEVEVFVGNENVALDRPCQVTNIETLPIHLDDQHALTDGVTTPIEAGKGYWIPEENTKASVTIDLVGKRLVRKE